MFPQCLLCAMVESYSPHSLAARWEGGWSRSDEVLRVELRGWQLASGKMVNAGT